MNEDPSVKRRAYRAPRREAAAAETRTAILAAAKDVFVDRGWAGTTIAAVAEAAGVSPKTVEAQHGTKAALLAAVVPYAIRGDTADTPMIERDPGRGVAAAPDAATLVERHVPYALAITSRSAQIAWVVESGARSDERVAEIWARMTHNRRFGARWAADLLLGKRGARADLDRDQAASIFLVAIDWATYRSLRGELRMSARAVHDWVLEYERRMLLAQPLGAGSG
jgi:AcrR family transcriptional regulator